MRNPVENLMQTNNSTLPQTSAPRNGDFQLSFIPKDYTFDEFLTMMEMIKPRYFRIATCKYGINIIFGVTKKKAFFGRAGNFSEAFRKLVSDMRPVTEA
jgi:hypothetical protein